VQFPGYGSVVKKATLCQKVSHRIVMTEQTAKQPLVGLFVTCTVDLIRPTVAFACIKLLENAGCKLVVPAQSCCGQVGYNNGLGVESRQLARLVIDSFIEADYVVTPSGSCASMLKNHYPDLFDNPEDRALAEEFSAKVYELTSFLSEILPPASSLAVKSDYEKIAYHDSCSGLRELGIYQQPRSLARSCRNAEFIPNNESDVCCGFGGTFCVKFEDIANKMVADKTRHIVESQPDLLLGGDLSCLLHIAGALQRQGHRKPEVRHIAEFLAGFDDEPGIGQQQ